jgi:ketosteroid isomerase-like protein
MRMPPARRHGAEVEAQPDNRLRLTIGLRKQGGRWVAAHEHDSFTSKD